MQTTPITETEAKPKPNVFKENWSKRDELCPHCGAVTKRQRGLTKQNLMKLFKPAWNMNEFLIMFMLLMVLVLAFSYNNEVKQCRDWIKPMFEGDRQTCLSVCDTRCQMIGGISNKPLNYTYPKVNLTGVLIPAMPITNGTNETQT